MCFSFAFQVFDLMRTQEQTRLAEIDAEKVYYELIQTQGDIVSNHL
jgi:ATPase family AAA domain-containing protein 3A/B